MMTGWSRAVGEAAARPTGGKAAIMSFDHWLIREFPAHAPGIPAGLTAWGDTRARARSAFLDAGAWHLVRLLLPSTHLPNRFVSFVREQAGHAGDHLDRA